ncbi:MAG: sigma factor-like helix-turn-helix DNA-binding protein, partial [Acidimicrobiia bacterium]
RILMNLFISSYRKKQREPVVLATEDAQTFDLYRAAGEPKGEESAESVVLERLVDDEVKDALSDLPEIFRVPVLLADVEGFSYKEISGMLGIPIGTVMSRLHRGRKALQKTLWELARKRGFVSQDGS